LTSDEKLSSIFCHKTRRQEETTRQKQKMVRDTNFETPPSGQGSEGTGRQGERDRSAFYANEDLDDEEEIQFGNVDTDDEDEEETDQEAVRRRLQMDPSGVRETPMVENVTQRERKSREYLKKPPSADDKKEKPKVPKKPSLTTDTPVKRTDDEFVRQALRQSTGISNVLPSEKDYVVSQEAADAAKEIKKRQVQQDSGKILIDGRPVTIMSMPLPFASYAPARQWDKTQRAKLEPDVLQSFNKLAGGWTLGKNNKLNVPKVTASSEHTLNSVRNLQTQLKQLKSHMLLHDIYDVMCIVIPVDVLKTPIIETTKFDLFDDYNKLHIAHVTNSNVWYNTWIQESYIRENMTLTYQCVQSNCDEALFLRCREQYDEFEPVQQGGPLLLLLVLKAIQDSSDQALEYLISQLKILKISKLPGEDIEQAVTLIKSTYRVLKSSSTDNRTYVPADFPKLVYNILMTCTVKDFTEPIKTHMDALQVAADMAGSNAAAYPSITKLLNMALNAYRRMKLSGVWTSQTGRKSQASLTAQPSVQPVVPSSSQPSVNNATQSHQHQDKGKYVRKCWNCDSIEHVLGDCPDPHNQAKIDANRKKFAAFKRSRGRSSTKVVNGKPMKLNKNGYYVLDQKAMREQKKLASLTAVPDKASLAAQVTSPEVTSSQALVSTDTVRSNLKSKLRWSPATN